MREVERVLAPDAWSTSEAGRGGRTTQAEGAGRWARIVEQNRMPPGCW
ncbi:hypothetical protein [Sorangium cellulosum]|nr:hypothetical protein [Sorangium cellulosum]